MTSTTEEETEIEEDTEVVIEVTGETPVSEAEMIEDPEEILVKDPKPASTVVRRDTMPETVRNVRI